MNTNATPTSDRAYRAVNGRTFNSVLWTVTTTLAATIMLLGGITLTNAHTPAPTQPATTYTHTIGGTHVGGTAFTPPHTTGGTTGNPNHTE